MGSSSPPTLVHASGADSALQCAHAGFAGVVFDDCVQCLRCEAQLRRLDAVLFQLLGHQIFRGNVELFLRRVAAERNDVHAVVERARNGGSVVCRGDKQHVAEVERQVDVMVLKRAVLFGIEHLKQRCGRIALKALTELIDLIEQDEGVIRARLLHSRHDATRHGADVGAAMAHDVRFVAHAAEGNTHVLAAGRLGDRARNGRFANARRADKANDLPRRLVRELAHGERLQKSCFNLFHAVMVAVENFLRAVEVQALLGARVPRQLKARFEVHAHNGALMRAVWHFGEAIALF